MTTISINGQPPFTIALKLPSSHVSLVLFSRFALLYHSFLFSYNFKPFIKTLFILNRNIHEYAPTVFNPANLMLYADCDFTQIR